MMIRSAARPTSRFAMLAAALSALSCADGGRSAQASPSSPWQGDHSSPSVTLPAPDPNLRAAPPSPAAADALVRYNFDRINALRATKNVPPLAYDGVIGAFARKGSEQLARDHQPHAHFAANTKRPPPGFGNRMAENQGDPGGVFVMDKDPTINGRKQIDIMLKLMFDEGPGGGHYDNMMNPLFKRVGIGLVYVQNRLYMTNDFSS